MRVDQVIDAAFKIIIVLCVVSVGLAGALVYKYSQPEPVCGPAVSEPVYCDHPVTNCQSYVEDVDIWIKKYDKMYDQYVACTCDLAECQSVLYNDIMSVTPECIR